MLLYKTLASQIKSFDDQALIIEHFISTEDRDRGGDRMMADGCVIDGIPAVLFQHGVDMKFGAEPIAKPLSIVVGNYDGKKGLIAKTQYFPDETGKRLYQKAKEGYMSSWSIGWEPIEAEPENGGRLVKKWFLYEYSQVNVPMNPGATTINKELDNIEFKHFINKKDNEQSSASQSSTAPAGQPQTPAQGVSPESAPFSQSLPVSEQSGILTKSIAQRVNGRIPYDNMMTCIYAFTDELFNIEPSKKAVMGVIQELTDMITPYALQFVTYLAEQRASNKSFNAIEYKTLLTNKKSEESASSVPAQEVPQTTTTTEQPPVQEAAQSEETIEGEIEFADDVVNAVSANGEKQEAESDEGLTLDVTPEQLTAVVKESVQEEFNKSLYGRVSN